MNKNIDGTEELKVAASKPLEPHTLHNDSEEPTQAPPVSPSSPLRLIGKMGYDRLSYRTKEQQLQRKRRAEDEPAGRTNSIPGSELIVNDKHLLVGKLFAKGAHHFARHLSIRRTCDTNPLTPTRANEELVVVTPLEKCSATGTLKQKKAFERFCILYPGENYKSAFFEFANKATGEQTYRVVMPHLGTILADWIERPCKIGSLKRGHLTQINKLEMILAAAQELQRIHDKGYVHGDLKCNNIAIKIKNGQTTEENGLIKISEGQYQTTYFDLEYSTPIGSPAIVFEPVHATNPHIAPERVLSTEIRKRSSLPSEPSQDTYSFAVMLKIFIEKGVVPSLNTADIQIWISQTLYSFPAQRPNLSSLIDNLKEALLEAHIANTFSTEEIEVARKLFCP
jgi:hypothetical protein